MKTGLINAAFAASVLMSAAMLLSSCDKTGPDAGAGQTPEGSEVLGTYEFDGKTYDILTAVFTASGNYYTFLFSPQSNGDGESITTYFQFAVNTYWADGDSHKVNNDYGGENLDHQDDYFLVYEDPVHYYSYHNEPQSGSFVVSMGNDGNPKSVMLDVRLADGTPLKVNYSGKFETTEDASAE